MVAPFIATYTSPSTCKVWEVENTPDGTIGGTPASWEDPSFDDAAWDAATDVANYDYFFGTDLIDNLGPPPAPSKYIATADAPTEDHGQGLIWLARMSFTLSDLPTEADLFHAEDNSAVIKINGVIPTFLVGSSIDPAPFVIGENVLTAEVTNGVSPARWDSGNPTYLVARLYTDVEEGTPTEPGVWIDWDDDGFDTGTTDTVTDPLLTRLMPQAAAASISDNVTTYTKSFTWNRGGSYDHVGSDGPGGCTILLKNMDGRFDPDNTASPVYGKIVPGLPVWIGAIKETGALSGTGTVRGVFGGFVREFNPTVRNGERVCEVICEDAFGRWSKTPVTVEPSLTRSHGELREAILDAIGEDSLHRSLEAEAGNMPISAVDSENTLSVLEELNTSTASRHFVAPADTKEGWYTYTVVNRQHALADAASETWNGDDIRDVSGWRVTNDNVIEQQRASISPITITSNNDPVWVYEGVPFSLTFKRSQVIWAEFDDYVFDASLDYNVSSGEVSAEFTNFGKTAKIQLWTPTRPGGANVSKLQILGRKVVRGDAQQVIGGSTDPGVRAGSVISSDYIGTPAMAQGICDFIVWKFSQALKRPSMTIVGKNTATLATIFERDIYDVIDAVIDKLSVTSRRLEIIGLSGACDIGVGPSKWSVTYELQETPNSAAVHYFTVDTDTVGGGVPVAPF